MLTALLASAALLMSACAAQPGGADAGSVSTTASSLKADTASALNAAAPSAASGLRPKKPEDINLAELYGARPEKVLEWFGTPGLVIKDGPSQAMVYDTGECILDISLTEDTTALDYYRVNHIAARSKDGKGMDLDDCVQHYYAKRQ